MIRSAYIAAFLIADCLLVGTLDYAYAQVSHLMLLENSSQPAWGDECERAFGVRPDFTVSRQDRTGEPHHHRTCGFYK